MPPIDDAGELHQARLACQRMDIALLVARDVMQIQRVAGQLANCADLWICDILPGTSPYDANIRRQSVLAAISTLMQDLTRLDTDIRRQVP